MYQRIHRHINASTHQHFNSHQHSHGHDQIKTRTAELINTSTHEHEPIKINTKTRDFVVSALSGGHHLKQDGSIEHCTVMYQGLGLA
jgi:predicted glycoside hydrolase/deacetylase ChbG (UPF0249 family)